MNRSPSAYPGRKKFKVTPKIVLAYLCLIPIAIGIGFGTFAIIRAVQKKQYFRPQEDLVRMYCEDANIPVHAAYALMYATGGLNNSNGDPNCVGYMALSPELFQTIGALVMHEQPEPGLIYDPATNLKYGIAYLGYLFDRYLLWDTAFAAYLSDIETVDGYLKDPDVADQFGAVRASAIPDEKLKKQVSKTLKALETYNTLYEEN
ncbi:MAG: transglycosylase SLT domain-containing protein [Clostridia bacterium]|nr:transglycosylase SLT domain-containing protein [Clostridia bacterium]